MGDSSSQEPCLKNQKLCESSQDRISSIPDEILYQILSFLPLKRAMKTSILSKRWEYLWVSYPILDFDLLHLYVWDDDDDDAQQKAKNKERYMNKLTNFLDRMLALRYNLCIQRFRFHSYGEIIDFSRLYSWVCAVMSCNVRELDLKSTLLREIVGFPLSLFTCKSLMVLKISGAFVFNVPYYVCLPNLKTLHLRSLTYIDDTSIQKFFKGCPALEELKMEGFRRYNVCTFNISGPSLKRFTLRYRMQEEKFFKDKIIVYAPNLEYLDIYNSSSDNIIWLNDLSSLIEACVSNQDYGDHAYGLLRAMSNVRHLSLTDYTSRSLNYACRANLPTFHNLVHLELGFDEANDHPLLPDLLEASPKLEVLVFPNGITPTEERYKQMNIDYEHMDIDYEHHWSPTQEVPECLLLTLKTIEFHKFWGDKKDLMLVNYLMKSAMVLEKMTIVCDNMISDDKFYNLKDELSNYAKASTNCQFKLHGFGLEVTI